MARDFNGTDQWILIDSALVSSPPFTMACWFDCDQITSNDTLMSIGDKDVGDNYHRLGAGGGIGGDPIFAQSEESAGNSFASTSTGYSANTWHHAAGVWASTTDRRVFIDGGSKGTNTVSRAPANIDRFAIGDIASDATETRFDGTIAEAALWNVALTDEEIAILGAAYSPLMVRPQSLVDYWPIIGRTSPEIGIVGGNNLTVTGAVVAVHARIIYPTQPISGFAAAPVAGGISIPVVYHHRQRNF